ncbi:hypothetical protein EZS27_019657 [termite gut metagenome]|uniref:Uncharacterized protein n=1 Tax=termite gut metagenome TaxID=433724 RepID=A0A5J4RCJ0_9ZZZZ
MDAKEFFDKVVQMRLAQKDYFKTRAKCYLVKSKRYEKEIDSEIKRVQTILNETNNPKMKF